MAPRTFTLAYFGLPLGACLLAGDGHRLGFVCLSPIEAPGRRRLRRAIGRAPDFDALELDPDPLELERALTACNPDLIVSWFWTRKLPVRLLEQARLGGIGVHPSLLPRHRGPDPYFWAIDSGATETGVTVHRLSEAYDTGDILLQERLPIGDRNAWQLARALDRPSLRLLREATRRLARGETLPATPQQESAATLAPFASGAETRIDFEWPTTRILRRIRALSPVPGLALEVRGLPFFVTQASAAPAPLGGLLPGEAAVQNDAVLIRTRDAAVRIERALVAESSPHRAGCDLSGQALAALLRELHPDLEAACFSTSDE